MCWCTPEIRTPRCGKPGCEPPKTEVGIPGMPEGVVAVRYGEASHSEYTLNAGGIIHQVAGGNVGLIVKPAPGYRFTFNGVNAWEVEKDEGPHIWTARFRVTGAANERKLLDFLRRLPEYMDARQMFTETKVGEKK